VSDNLNESLFYILSILGSFADETYSDVFVTVWNIQQNVFYLILNTQDSQLITQN
jgi:hypothetical protein